MITFGYKSKLSSILRACAAIGIGLVMILATDATVTVVKIVAAFLMVVGVVSLVVGLIDRKTGSLPLLGTNAVVDLVLGVLLFLYPTQVAGFIVYAIGAVLIIFGILQLIVLIGALSLIGGGFLTLVLSICAIIGGIILVFNPFTMKVMSILAGAALIVYGVQELMSAWKVRKAVKVQETRRLETSGTIDAKDVDFVKEDEGQPEGELSDEDDW
ncbi:MAG: DUF308 domain-containing protein [Bacteroidales bacterium]|nr:DUF308 domain-containing protein [Bacteroidales bacterium]